MGQEEPSRQPRRERRSARQWCIPPAITADPRETLEGTTILAELPGDEGHVLWVGLREVTLWAAMDPESRGGYLADRLETRLAEIAEAKLDPRLGSSLTALTSVLRGIDPEPQLLSLICANVSDWAADHGAPATALHFAQAGALADPLSADPALRVGRLALAGGQHARAETWLRRAVGLARREHTWKVYALAYVELAELYRTAYGSPARAERYYTIAYRAARRKGLRPVLGAARHGLFLLRLAAGDLDAAARLAQAAGRAYGRGHPALPRLRRETAELALRQGDPARAVHLLRDLLPTCADPTGRMHLHALLARAAAEAGEVELYREHWLRAWEPLHEHRGSAAAAPAMLELARASAHLRDAERVRMVARMQPGIPEPELERLAALAGRPPGPAHGPSPR